ncbi:MAG: HAD family phosphatase [Proteobacteria bacterium]|nr:HAD family phosphatase [Pseudomonadota bacterium]
MTQSPFKPAGIIFDFDGVVVDSLEVHLTAWKSAYQELYHCELSDTFGLPGRSTGAIATILSTRAGRPSTIEALATLKKRHLSEAMPLIKPFPGVLDSFSYLSSHGIPFGIASNAPRAFILKSLEAIGATVEIIFGVDDVSRPKPAPDIFLACARALKIPFQQHPTTIVFEDSLHGLAAAVAAGMYPVGIETQHNEYDLVDAGAKRTFKDIAHAKANGIFAI